MLGFNRFSLLAKILFVAVVSFISLTVVLFILYGFNVRNKTVEAYVSKARAITLTAESTRQEIEKKWEQGILTISMLREFAIQGEKEKVLGMVPVVSAWNSAMRKSDQGGYVFRVPKFSPRRPENAPDYGSDYKIEGPAINKMKDENLNEYYVIDKKINAVRYFLPVRLTENCMICHGDPADSKSLWGTDNGKDPTGGTMENWKVGQIHGAFEVIQYLHEADKQLIKDMSLAGIVAVFCILTAVLVFFLVIKNNVVNPIKKIITGLDIGSTEVAEASSNVSSSSQYLADGASSQAAAVEEISSALEEISSMTKMNASNATSADELMTEANEIVKKANTYMEHLTESMDKIMADSEETSKIIKTIDEIAFQTNILAINAAVEAARAGEAGAGFAVVSDEVRALALRAAQAANSTTGLIENNLKSTEDGTRIVKETGSAFTRVFEATSKASTLVSEIATSSKEQAMGTEQVNKSIADVDKVTQDNAATAEESAASSEELNAQAETMSSYIANLRKIITGKDIVKTERSKKRKSVRVAKAREIKPEKILPLSDDDF